MYGPPDTSGIHYLGLRCEDCDWYDMRQHVDIVKDFIDLAKEEGGKAVVHCMAGTMAFRYSENCASLFFESCACGFQACIKLGL